MTAKECARQDILKDEDFRKSPNFLRVLHHNFGKSRKDTLVEFGGRGLNENKSTFKIIT
jgi:hypothetical protein